MTWTAIFSRAEKLGWNWDVTILFTDGQRKTERSYQVQRLTDDAIKAVARQGIDSLSVVDQGAGKISITQGAVIDTAAPAPPQPTPEELARDSFRAIYRDWRQLARAAEIGLIAADDKRIGDAFARLQSAFDPSYMDML